MFYAGIAAGFLEFWKRETSLLQHQWDVNDMQDILEVPRAEFLQVFADTVVYT